MLIKVFLSIVIAGLVYGRRLVDFRFKIFFHPIVLAPLLGLLLGEGGLTTGATVGAIVELIWGSNLVDYQLGLKYSLLVSLLTVPMVIFTNNISLFFNLTLVVILVFAFQEALGWLEDSKYFVLLIIGFNLLMFSSIPLFDLLLGITPAQFLNSLAISGGAFIPAVGLALLLIQAVWPTLSRDHIWYYSYGIATAISSLFLLNGYYKGVIIFLIIWFALYKFSSRFKVLDFKKYLRIFLSLAVIVATPLILKLNSHFITGTGQYILWSEMILAIASSLRVLKLTAIEGYFILTLLGVIVAKIGIFI